jgi:hypothetical protein
MIDEETVQTLIALATMLNGIINEYRGIRGSGVFSVFLRQGRVLFNELSWVLVSLDGKTPYAKYRKD